ncbi:hypothetical protein O3P69_019779 [Scylla paramamosain]|uniref:Uncharacterized protein n=1 Tax=Scylla paramamosain TaxID=85552 RepID=A0AAW0SYH3_SCYPA
MLGATGAAQGVYERCDTKHIQLDTLGHVLALQALDSASYTTAAAIFSATLKFFMANYKDTSDPLIASYKYGSLTRIPEFVEFRETLSNSLHFATVTAEQMLLDLTTNVSSHTQLVEALQHMDISPATDRTDWGHLTDNRDLKVMNSWEPPHRRLKEEDIAASVAADTALLRLRNLTLRLVGAACTLCPPAPPNNSVAAANKENSECVNGEGGGGGGDSDIFNKLTAKLQEEYQSVYTTYANTKPLQLPLQGPDPPRLYLFVTGSYLSLITRHAQVLQRVYRYTLDPAGTDTWSSETLKETREETENILDRHHQHVTALQTTPLQIDPGINTPALARLHHLAQAVGVAAILLGCCVALLRPIKLQAAKRGKKRKEAVVMPEVIPQLSSYLSSFTSHLQRLEKALVAKHKQTNSAAAQETTAKISASLASLGGQERAGGGCLKAEEGQKGTLKATTGSEVLEKAGGGCLKAEEGQKGTLKATTGLGGQERAGGGCLKAEEGQKGTSKAATGSEVLEEDQIPCQKTQDRQHATTRTSTPLPGKKGPEDSRAPYGKTQGDQGAEIRASAPLPGLEGLEKVCGKETPREARDAAHRDQEGLKSCWREGGVSHHSDTTGEGRALSDSHHVS